MQRRLAQKLGYSQHRLHTDSFFLISLVIPTLYEQGPQLGVKEQSPTAFASPRSSPSSAGTFPHRKGESCHGEGQRVGDTRDGGGEVPGKAFWERDPKAQPHSHAQFEILLEGCQEPCLPAAPASQSPLLPDAVSAEPNASSTTPQPHPAMQPTPPGLLQEPAFRRLSQQTNSKLHCQSKLRA